MGFEQNILECFNCFTEPMFKACLIGDNAVYLQGVKGLKSFSNESIVVFLKRGEVEIKGENLYIKKYCLGDVAICGKINAILRS